MKKYRYETPRLYEAYIRGARDLRESISTRVPSSELREIDDWFSELEAWQGFGDPPPPPPPQFLGGEIAVSGA